MPDQPFDLENLSPHFPILGQLDFFNHAAVAPISGPAGEAIRRYVEQATGRAYVQSGWYKRAAEIKGLAARLINAPSAGQIAFVPNTSAGLSILAKGLDWRRGDDVVITAVEFPANRYPWEDLKSLGVNVIEVQQRRDGRIDVDDVLDAITSRTRVVSLSHVQYASGHRIDLKPIADMVHQARGLLCVDAIQSVGAMPVDVRGLGVDFLSADGHKWMLSPEGCGIVYCEEDLIQMLRPNVVGWMNMPMGKEFGDYKFQFHADARRFEPGSYNIAGIMGLGASLEMLLQIGMENVWRRIESLTDRLCAGLEAKGYRVFSPRGPGEKSGIVSFDAPDPATHDKTVADLESRNIIIARREGRLRASPHFYNTPEQIDRLIAALP